MIKLIVAMTHVDRKERIIVITAVLAIIVVITLMMIMMVSIGVRM